MEALNKNHQNQRRQECGCESQTPPEDRPPRSLCSWLAVPCWALPSRGGKANKDAADHGRSEADSLRPRYLFLCAPDSLLAAGTRFLASMPSGNELHSASLLALAIGSSSLVIPQDSVLLTRGLPTSDFRKRGTLRAHVGKIYKKIN